MTLVQGDYVRPDTLRCDGDGCENTCCVSADLYAVGVSIWGRPSEWTTRLNREGKFVVSEDLCPSCSAKENKKKKEAPMAAEKEDKSLDVENILDAKKKVSDIKVVGNGDMFKLLCKASSREQGWMKSSKAMEIPGVGCVVQVTTQQGDNVAEALTFVPGVVIAPDENGGNKLVAQAELNQPLIVRDTP